MDINKKRSFKKTYVVLALVAILIIFFSVLPLPRISSKGFKFSKMEDGTYRITQYTGNASYVEIPETIRGVKVTKIAPEAFENKTCIKTVVIHNNIVEIGNYAFYGCNQLNELLIPTSVVRIGNYAFADSNINVLLSENEALKEIGDYAFSNNITEIIDLPDSVETIGNNAFYLSSLKTLNIGELSVLKSIGESAFIGSKLESIYLPSTLTNVGTMTIYYKVERDNYVTVTGSEEVTITPAGRLISP